MSIECGLSLSYIMSKNNKKTIHIIGAGPAGMATSYYANKNNLNSIIYESSDAVGGNCKTLKEGDFLFDLGAHRLHDKNHEVTSAIKELLDTDLLEVNSPSKIFWKDKFFNFPLQITDILFKLNFKTKSKIIYENIVNKLSSKIEFNSFEDVAYNNYGKTISDLFLTNYTKKLWGRSCNDLLPEISGGRLKNLNIRSILKEFIFNKKLKSQHLDGKFLYPKYGYGTIFETIKNMNGLHKIHLNSPITKLLHNNKKINKIIYHNKEVSVEHLVSTLPINLLIKMLDPIPENYIIEEIDSISFRGLKLCAIFLDVERCSDNASIYFPSKDIPFTRLYEPKNRSNYMAPNNQTCIVIEIPYNQNLNRNNDNYFMDMVIEILIDKKIIKRKNILFSKLIDMPFAYPILTLDVKEKISCLLEYLKRFKNLNNFGRNAEFKYLHTHDLFNSANHLVKSIKNQI